MDTFRAYMLRKAYKNVRENGDKLADVEPLIDWRPSAPSSNPYTTTRDPAVADPTPTQ